MTFQEMHNEMDLALDRAQNPYFDSIEKDSFLNNALDKFMDKYAPQNQRTQEFRDLLGGLTTNKMFGSVKTIEFADLPRYRRLLGMTGDYEFFCKAEKQVTRRTVPITPSNEDSVGVDLTSPFQVPTDQFPAYRELKEVTGNRKWEILSTNAPLSVEMVYLMNPKKIDGTSNPNGTLLGELPISAIRKVLDTAIVLAMTPQQNQSLQSQLITNNNQ